MGLSERLVIIVLALIVIAISFMLFMLGLFFLQNRRRSEEFFMKSFPEQMKSLGFFREIPLFGQMYYNVGTWYTRTFPPIENTDTTDHWHTQSMEHPIWLNQHTVKYFVMVVALMLIAYSIITAVVSVGGIYIMIKPMITSIFVPNGPI